MKPLFTYMRTENLPLAVAEMQKWFLAHGCEWTGFRNAVPDRAEIMKEYNELCRVMLQRDSDSCESGGLKVENNPVMYCYKTLRTEVSA